MVAKLRDFLLIAIVSFLLLEGVLRFVLFSDVVKIPTLQQAWRYVPADTDESWKLQYLWGKKWGVSSADRIHPLLGWSQKNVTAQNPFGFQEDTVETLRSDGRNKILFYGDSFVKGASDPEYHIPRYMNQQTPMVDVIDLGVPGYGTDQIYLLFKETYSKVNSPLIIVGVLLADIDRTVLSFRTAQKPYLTVDSDGKLMVNGLPIEKDQPGYVDSHPPQIISYAFSLIKTKLGLFKMDKTAAKKTINSAIIENTKAIVRRENIPLIYVIFYGIDMLKTEDWRETFLKTELDRNNIPFVDTKTALISYAKANDLPISNFYVENEGHHNNLGNQIIADRILGELVLGCEKWQSEFCSFEISTK